MRCSTRSRAASGATSKRPMAIRIPAHAHDPRPGGSASSRRTAERSPPARMPDRGAAIPETGAEDGLLGAQLLAQRVERLVETAASALLLLLPPEQCRQAVPVHPAPAGAGQDREDRETPRLLGVAAQRAAIVEHRHPAERLDVLS